LAIIGDDKTPLFLFGEVGTVFYSFCGNVAIAQLAKGAVTLRSAQNYACAGVIHNRTEGKHFSEVRNAGFEFS